MNDFALKNFGKVASAISFLVIAFQDGEEHQSLHSRKGTVRFYHVVNQCPDKAEIVVGGREFPNSRVPFRTSGVLNIIFDDRGIEGVFIFEVAEDQSFGDAGTRGNLFGGSPIEALFGK